MQNSPGGSQGSPSTTVRISAWNQRCFSDNFITAEITGIPVFASSHYRADTQGEPNAL
jgi:hypothetical protein